MIPSFEEALADLLDKYADYDRDEVISFLELALMARKEEAASDDEDKDEAVS